MPGSAPEPNACPRRFATGTPGSLVGRILAYGLGEKRIEPPRRIKAIDTRKAGVDHMPHAGNGKRRFGDIGRHNDLPASRRLHDLVLPLPGKIAIERQHA